MNAERQQSDLITIGVGTGTGKSFRIVLIATFTGFCSFYGPQPLLPTFAAVFGVSATMSAWMLTLPFICLAVGPILVGTVLQHSSAQRVLAVACLILAIALFGFANSEDFKWLMTFRALQSLMFPVIFTSAVTYCSRAGDAESQQTRIAIYITATIVGGFSGRLISGFLGDALGWQAPFFLFAFLALVSAVAIWFAVANIPLDGNVLQLKSVFKLTQKTDIRAGLAFVFITFFTFAGTLNVIPFRLVSLDSTISSSVISLVYVGYAVGIFIPLVINSFIQRIGGEVRAIGIGFGLLLTGLAGLAIPSVSIMFVVFLILSAGMFTIHATVSGYLNKLNAENASLVNGAYISNYYSAAAIGSIIPVWVVNHFGWAPYVVAQFLFALTAARYLMRLNSITTAES